MSPDSLRGPPSTFDLMAPGLQEEAELLNRTAGEESESPTNQTHLLQEVELMLDRMRGLHLTEASSLANQQLL